LSLKLARGEGYTGLNFVEPHGVSLSERKSSKQTRKQKVCGISETRELLRLPEAGLRACDGFGDTLLNGGSDELRRELLDLSQFRAF
jgi:hypothetical protein